MKPDFVDHLRREWPLALVVAGLLIYLPVVLLGGVFYTNQGNVVREKEPERYWRWIRRFGVLLLASLIVLIGSYFL